MYYIFDHTRKNDQGKTLVAMYNTTAEVVAHLETMCPRMFDGKTRKQLMNDALDFGFGDDDREGKAFYSYLEQYVQTGVIRKDGTPIKCNIFTADEYKNPNYGD